ncbi:MAG: hypothetical protein NZ899_03055 [Thermoguttaceae bacterium]|nr:hypothetical protein [Thermoguttaceae bacterium]MDW8079700.1 hypothetical protein [Thermoguttaceae bacterium]
MSWPVEKTPGDAAVLPSRRRLGLLGLAFSRGTGITAIADTVRGHLHQGGVVPLIGLEVKGVKE